MPSVAPQQQRLLTDDALAEAVLACQRELSRFVHRLYEPRSSLGLSQLRTLGELQRCGAVRITELADLLQISLPAMTQGIDRLEAHGWVLRTAAERDRRGVDVAITAAGQAAYQDACAGVIRALGERLDRLDDEERAAIARALPALERLVRG